MNVRESIYNVIKPQADDTKLSRIYDMVMIIAILISIIPLWFHNDYEVFEIVEKVTVSLFIIDYLMRWATADYLFESKSIWSFIRYPFSLMALIDLITILPGMIVINDGFKALRVIRLLRALRIVRIFKTFKYSKNVARISRVINNQRDNLMTVLGFAVSYVLFSATIMFRVEPNTFKTFFDAIYWATISLTSVGYGDIYAVTVPGRICTMLSAVFGIAVIALPAGLITAGYLEEVEKEKEAKDKDKTND